VIFYVLSMFSSGTPIFIPYLHPYSYYNVRYGLAALPFIALAAGAVLETFPDLWRRRAVTLFAMGVMLPWMFTTPDHWICWKESQVNSDARRKWTAEAAAYLRANYRMGSGIFTSFGDLAGIFPAAGIPLREALHEGNGPAFLAALKKPEAFLFEEWVLVQCGDAVQKAISAASVNGPRYRLVKRIAIGNEKVVEIYRRDRARLGMAEVDAAYAEYRDRETDEEAGEHLDEDGEPARDQ
jgi:hypothetical protein